MESKNMIGGIVSLAVVVICVAAIMMPVLSDATSETKTYTNEGTPFAVYDGEEHTIVIAYDGTTYTITTDGESCELPDFSLYGAATIVYGENGFIRMTSGGVIRGFIDGSFVLGGNVSESVTSTITLTSTGGTIVYGSTTRTLTFTPLAYIAPEGDYVQCANPCVDDDTVIIGGATDTTDATTGYAAYGSIDSLTASVVYFNPSDTSLSVSSVDYEVNTTAVNGDLKRIDSVVFTATLSDDSTISGTYTFFLAPATITYDNPGYVGSGNSAILGAIPVMVIAALIIGAVGVFITSKRD